MNSPPTFRFTANHWPDIVRLSACKGNQGEGHVLQPSQRDGSSSPKLPSDQVEPSSEHNHDVRFYDWCVVPCYMGEMAEVDENAIRVYPRGQAKRKSENQKLAQTDLQSAKRLKLYIGRQFVKRSAAARSHRSKDSRIVKWRVLRAKRRSQNIASRSPAAAQAAVMPDSHAAKAATQALSSGYRHKHIQKAAKPPTSTGIVSNRVATRSTSMRCPTNEEDPRNVSVRSRSDSVNVLISVAVSMMAILGTGVLIARDIRLTNKKTQQFTLQATENKRLRTINHSHLYGALIHSKLNNHGYLIAE